MPGEAASGLFAGASRKALLGIPMLSRLMDRDQYEWLRCRLRRILPLLELQINIQTSQLDGPSHHLWICSSTVTHSM